MRDTWTDPTTPTGLAAMIRADLAQVEDRIDELTELIDYRSGSSVSRAVDYLRIAAGLLDSVPTLDDEAQDFDLDAPHIIPEDFAV